ncbi:class I SAM-dependent methyltransferase [Phormidium sp. FACHB-592]|nr:class I SAM-dependent methyltransferase [Phormidium sp. FACHB-592]MBD2077874.1 class I SAM-dependent methyltransferase [Phormidium sp. FACHB-592]
MFINPFYFARKGLYQHIKALSPSIKGKTLDVGCGQKPYQGLYPNSDYIGLEIGSFETNCNRAADYFYDGVHFPFAEQEFDSVITNQVFEHVFNPDQFLSEIYRILKPEGFLLLTVPFVWDEHEQPVDYARYSSFGLKHILEANGFKVLEQRKSMADVRTLFQLANGYLYKKTVTKSNVLNSLITLVLMSPLNLLGELLAIILPKNEDLYLDNIVLARKTGNLS